MPNQITITPSLNLLLDVSPLATRLWRTPALCVFSIRLRSLTRGYTVFVLSRCCGCGSHCNLQCWYSTEPCIGAILTRMAAVFARASLGLLTIDIALGCLCPRTGETGEQGT